jgi:hypothetical protein
MPHIFNQRNNKDESPSPNTRKRNSNTSSGTLMRRKVMQQANALKKLTTKKAFDNAIKKEEVKQIHLDLTPTAEFDDFASSFNKINHGIQSSHTLNEVQLKSDHDLGNGSAYH